MVLWLVKLTEGVPVLLLCQALAPARLADAWMLCCMYWQCTHL
jgi:hypothetical protein